MSVFDVIRTLEDIILKVDDRLRNVEDKLAALDYYTRKIATRNNPEESAKMTPLEILTDTHKEATMEDLPVSDLITKDIKLFSSPSREWEVLSYYYSEEEETMVLDISRKGS